MDTTGGHKLTTSICLHHWYRLMMMLYSSIAVDEYDTSMRVMIMMIIMLIKMMILMMTIVMMMIKIMILL